MTLKEYQEARGIKRIDFNKVKATRKEPTFAENELECPYCNETIDYDSDDEDDILDGTVYECPHCGKQFYAVGEISTVSTVCRTMEDHVLRNQMYIEDNYHLMDAREAQGMDFFNNSKASLELSMFNNFALPLFENAAMDKDEDSGNK